MACRLRGCSGRSCGGVLPITHRNLSPRPRLASELWPVVDSWVQSSHPRSSRSISRTSRSACRASTRRSHRRVNVPSACPASGVLIDGTSGWSRARCSTRLDDLVAAGKGQLWSASGEVVCPRSPGAPQSHRPREARVFASDPGVRVGRAKQDGRLFRVVLRTRVRGTPLAIGSAARVRRRRGGQVARPDLISA